MTDARPTLQVSDEMMAWLQKLPDWAILHEDLFTEVNELAAQGAHLSEQTLAGLLGTLRYRDQQRKFSGES